MDNSDRFAASRFTDFLIFLLFIALVIGVRVATVSHYPVPVPAVHDEFSNLLGAQTFALGRLTNPAAPFAESLFEFHTLDAPTRMTVYQPASAAFMALGIVFFNEAYWGVVLCMALAIASGYWALRGWVGRSAAFTATCLLLLLFRAPHYWIDSYWGGGPILLASFLMLGAYARVFNAGHFRYIALGLLGFVLALLSRPFEGLLLALCLAVAGFCRLSREDKIRCLRASVLPVLLILPAYFAFQLYYNHSITGNWLSLPYALYARQHLVASSFIIGTPHPEAYASHYALHNLQAWEMEMMALKQHAGPFLYLMSLSYLLQLERFTSIAAMSLAFAAMVIAFVAVPLKQGSRQRALGASWLVLLVGFLLTTGTNPHYLAPQFAVAVILLCIWWQQMFRHKRLLSGALLAVVGGCAILYDGNIFAVGKTPPLLQNAWEEELERTPGKDLVFVDLRRKAKEGPLHTSYVHNAPDIESAEIIWAWYLSPEENQKLIAHYKGRTLWYIEPTQDGRLVPYDKR